MTTRLTLFYTASVFILLSVASAVLYWGLQKDMREADREFLDHKLQVLAALLARQPLDRSGVEQEVLEEAQISSHSPSPFLLRVLDESDRVIDETPGMSAVLPATEFPVGVDTTLPERRWRSAHGMTFLLGSRVTPGSASKQAHWRVQAALNVSAQEALLAGYRHDIALVLGVGLLSAALFGFWIARRGLQPLEEITRATERIGVQQLQDRIQTGRWPQELESLAAAFDGMLDRLQEAFQRLSQFSADLAHELRTPINNLMGEAHVALSRPRTDVEYIRGLQSALEEYNRLAHMIDSMLFLAQAEQAGATLNRIPLDALAELRAVADFFQALADEQGVELMCEGHARIVADSSLLRRALSNLVSNALRFTPCGGRITLRAAEATDGAPILSVIDSGVGIESQHLPHLGDRFYRVDPSRTSSLGGAGLGLAIVKSVIALHGGKLLIESVPGKGTMASLFFTTEAGPARTCA